MLAELCISSEISPDQNEISVCIKYNLSKYNWRTGSTEELKVRTHVKVIAENVQKVSLGFELGQDL